MNVLQTQGDGVHVYGVPHGLKRAADGPPDNRLVLVSYAVGDAVALT